MEYHHYICTLCPFLYQSNTGSFNAYSQFLVFGKIYSLVAQWDIQYSILCLGVDTCTISEDNILTLIPWVTWPRWFCSIVFWESYVLGFFSCDVSTFIFNLGSTVTLSCSFLATRPFSPSAGCCGILSCSAGPVYIILNYAWIPLILVLKESLGRGIFCWVGTGNSSVKPHSLLNSVPETNSCCQKSTPERCASFLIYYVSSNINAVISLLKWPYSSVSIHI